jgi:hypothetical protein
VNGRANAIPAILQAGTAVLVDKYGVPRVKCYCGNPLTEPRYPAEPVYTGPRWPAFEPGGVVLIDNSVTVITVITVIDLETEEPFGRPVGTDGTSDTDAPTDGAARDERPGSESEAVELIREELERCLAEEFQGEDSFFTPEETQELLDTLQYASSGEVDGIVTVTVTGPEGDFASWRVDLGSGDITPADQTAAEVGQYCPTLA